MNIYVANIAYSAKDQDLRELFEAFGEVTSAKIIMDKATNRSRGFGFVEMADDTAGKGPAEIAGKQIDKAAVEAGKELKEVAQETGKALEKAGAKLQEKVQEKTADKAPDAVVTTPAPQK